MADFFIKNWLNALHFLNELKRMLVFWIGISLLVMPSLAITAPLAESSPGFDWGQLRLSGETVLSLIGCVQVAFLLPLILTVNSERPLSKYLFAALVLVIGLSFAEDVFHTVPALYRSYPHGIGIFYPSTFLIAPLLYLYVKSHLYPSFRLRFVHLLHWLPFLSIYLMLMDFYLLPAENKLALFEDDTGPDEIGVDDIMELIQIFAYLGVSFYIAINFNRQLRQQFSYEEKINVRWLIFLLSIMSLLALMYFLCGMFSLVDERWFSLLFLLTVNVLGFLAIRHRHAFNGLTTIAVIEETTSPDDASEKTYATQISTTDREHIRHSLVRLLETERLFLDSYLSLDRLADEMGMHANKVSRVINEDFDKNFFELVNGYRVRHCCHELVEHPGKSILDVAMDSGFNSKSAFYSAFKNETGKTPGEFRRTALVTS